MPTKSKQLVNTPAATPTSPTQTWAFWLMIIALALVAIARIQLLGMPLERDEGGYAYIGSHLFGSQRLYTDMYDIKLPGLYLLYACFDLLPGGPSTRIHLGLLCMHAGALWFFHQLIDRILGKTEAHLATALFAVSAVLPGVYGFASHATQLLQLPLMLALLLLWKNGSKRSVSALFFSGILLGIAFTIKQPAVVFIVFGLGVLLTQYHRSFGQRILDCLVLGWASLIPFLLILGWFLLQGRFADFWHWTFTMPTAQTVAADSMTYLKLLVPPMIGNHWLFWVLGTIAGCSLPFWMREKTAAWWITGLLLAAALSTVIGLGYMPHYFIPMIPWIAAALAIVLVAVAKRGMLAYHAVSAVCVLSAVVLNSAYFFKPDHARIAETCYHWNGFAELELIGEQLARRLKSGETIGIYGSEPQLNYYTNTLHCSPHLYMYPVIRQSPYAEQYQKQFADDLLKCQPAYLVVTASEASWMPGFTEMPIFKQELMSVVKEKYDLIGRANIGQQPMQIVWDEALNTHKPPQCPPIFVFKRR
jgi:hypothetical protein